MHQPESAVMKGGEAEPSGPRVTLDAFFLAHDSERLHEKAEPFFNKFVLRKLIPQSKEKPDLEEPPAFSTACTQLSHWVHYGSSTEHAFETEEDLKQACSRLVEEVNTICQFVLELIERGEINQAHLKKFHGILAPWTCNPITSVIGPSFWGTGVPLPAKGAVNEKYPGNSELMMAIRTAHKEIEAKELLGYAKGKALIEVASMLAPSAFSVVHRTESMAEALFDYHRNNPYAQSRRPLKVVELAGGDGSVSAAFLRKLSSAGMDVASVHLIDSDAHTLETVTTPTLEQLISNFNQMFLDVVTANIISTKDAPLVNQALMDSDCVFSMGFIDYLDREALIGLIRNIKDHAKPGASVSLGVFKKDYPHEAFMKLILRWALKTRTAEEIVAIATEAGLKDVKVFELPGECQLVLLGRTPTLEEREEEKRRHGAASSNP